MSKSLNDFINSTDTSILAYYMQDNDVSTPNWNNSTYIIKDNQSEVDAPELINYSLNDHVDGLWVHPRVQAKICTDSKRDNYGKCATLYGQNQQKYDWNWIQANGFKRNISYVGITSQDSFNNWKLKCCRQETSLTTNPQICGDYWSGKNCGTVDCTSVSNGIPKFASGDQFCTEWCLKNQSNCDSAKLAFCQKNPRSSLCGCINDTQEAIDERNNNIYLKKANPPRQCLSKSDCQKSDLFNTLIPSSLKPVNCPDIQNLTKTNFFSLDFSSITQTMGAVVNNGGDQKNNSMFLIILILIIFLILSIIVVVFFVID